MKTRTRIWSPYLLPNVLTSLNLFAGFYAITHIISRDFTRAVWGILIAAVMDGLDGMAARLTRGYSAFGIEFDSLADLVSFGLAPSLFMYLWLLKPYGRVGWVAAFLFMACGALRLARFNVQSGDVQKRHFLGVPIPMAAFQVVTTYLMLTHLQVPSGTAGVVLIVTAYLTAFLMISAVPYRSLKTVAVRRQHSFYVPVLFLLLTAIVWIYPPVVLWVLSTCYAISGPAEALARRVVPAWRVIPPPGEHQATANRRTGNAAHE